MLVITRRLDEEIVIGDDIRLKVVDIAGSRIRLGITAPREMAIRREGLDSQGARAHDRVAAERDARRCSGRL